MKTINELEKICSQIRRDIVRMVHANNSGHPGGSLGCTEFLSVLYFNQLKHDKSFNMDGINEDLFFLSNGHISPVLYSVLARSGYFKVQELATFRKLNSRLQGLLESILEPQFSRTLKSASGRSKRCCCESGGVLLRLLVLQ